MTGNIAHRLRITRKFRIPLKLMEDLDRSCSQHRRYQIQLSPMWHPKDDVLHLLCRRKNENLPEERQHGFSALSAIPLDCWKFGGQEVVPSLRLNQKSGDFTFGHRVEWLVDLLFEALG